MQNAQNFASIPNLLESLSRKDDINAPQKKQETQATLKQLEKMLCKGIETIFKAEEIVNAPKINETQQKELENNMQSFVNTLAGMGELSHKMEEMQVPVAIAEYVDNGKNPDELTKKFYEWSEHRNNHSRARIVNATWCAQNMKMGLKLLNDFQSQKD
ncbi:RNA polymerase II mediator complex protein [Reticulomyxa filosa]|uniref:Mediator of RNA polymerase II transcription subunit 10 n=1 Tax=Reticulomyxa filosa TaxID=46433 RepID=X6NIZ7_RETFI|nr:RNA polymerase II mediator complex protein [Reticulomyxa filosa]|eukprot:ETO25946.1 RNA polymerase II mediator complex protein [Reticulomyxa filosa]